MVAENNPNLWLLQTAAAKLEPLLDEIAFLAAAQRDCWIHILCLG